ncbi:MAG: hypothetical protein ACYC65_08100, partial [Candidatus Limnocylindrales bacterium]
MRALRERVARIPVEAIVLVALILLAALTRLPGLDERGRWDADQAHDMLVLRELVTEGSVPLLGPRTSIGTFHHGAAYYYLLAPAAVASNADPVAVTGWIALFGIGAVAGTWWLARLIGGPLAAAVAGLLAAVSPAGIDESTFIWNPNLIPVAAALAFGSVLRARQTGSDRWWLAAGLGAMVTMQCHVLGAVIVPPLALAWLLEVRRRHAAGVALRPLALAAAGAVAIMAAGYLPLVIHEIQSGFSETRAILDYLVGGGGTGGGGLLDRTLLVGLRSVTWPLAGLVTDRPALSMIAALVAVLLAAVAAVVGRGPDRAAVRWLLGSLAWSVVALAVFAPSLATITPGLPNDHYHAFLDPIVLALAGVGIARLAGVGAGRLAGVGGGRLAGVGGGRLSAVLAGALAVVLVAIGIVSWPPRVAEDGGLRLVDLAAARVAGSTGPGAVALDGVPPFKSADALRFPLLRHGVRLLPEEAGGAAGIGPAGAAVLVCDPLFDEVVGETCCGPAEDA